MPYAEPEAASNAAPKNYTKKRFGKRANGGGGFSGMEGVRSQVMTGGGGSVEDYNYLLGFKSNDEPNEF